jgi:hypothetical protein
VADLKRVTSGELFLGNAFPPLVTASLICNGRAYRWPLPEAAQLIATTSHLLRPRMSWASPIRLQSQRIPPWTWSAAELGSDRTPGPSLLHPREGAQFSYGHAKLPTSATHSEQGDTGIDHFGHFAGLTHLQVEWGAKECRNAVYIAVAETYVAWGRHTF